MNRTEFRLGCRDIPYKDIRCPVTVIRNHVSVVAIESGELPVGTKPWQVQRTDWGTYAIGISIQQGRARREHVANVEMVSAGGRVGHHIGAATEESCIPAGCVERRAVTKRSTRHC